MLSIVCYWQKLVQKTSGNRLICILVSYSSQQQSFSGMIKLIWWWQFEHSTTRVTVHRSHQTLLTNIFREEHDKEWSDQVIDSLHVAAGWVSDGPNKQDSFKDLERKKESQVLKLAMPRGEPKWKVWWMLGNGERAQEAQTPQEKCADRQKYAQLKNTNRVGGFKSAGKLSIRLIWGLRQDPARDPRHNGKEWLSYQTCLMSAVWETINCTKKQGKLEVTLRNNMSLSNFQINFHCLQRKRKSTIGFCLLPCCCGELHNKARELDQNGLFFSKTVPTYSEEKKANTEAIFHPTLTKHRSVLLVFQTRTINLMNRIW